MPIILKTKAQSLLALKNEVVHSTILDMYIFTVRDWLRNSEQIIKSIQNKFDFIVVRSSSLNEDNEDKTNAGRYNSVLNVNSKNCDELIKAIDDVVFSYNKEKNYLQNEILIQPMLTNINVSGVAFTYDIENNLPYYVITYDKDSQLTDTITGGKTNNICIEKILRKSREKIKNNKLLDALIELENLTNNQFLDVEFAIDNSGVLYLFQVRQLILKNKINCCDAVYFDLLNDTTNYFINKKHIEKISGRKVIYSNMVDWNPAELVGCHPPLLNLSLYNKIFTNKIWAEGRKLLGYKDIGSINLIQCFWGHPYINVLFDFNSYLPSGLNPQIENKLIEYYIDLLKLNKNEHDKAEFNIVDTCFSVDFDRKRYSDVLSELEIDEFEMKLKKLTNKILLDKEKIIEKTILEFESQKKKSDSVLSTNVETKRFLDETANTFSLYYAVIVRSAFICYKFFTALISCGLISQEEFSSFFNSFSSIASVQVNELNDCTDKKSMELFLQKYSCVKQNLFDITIESPYLDMEFIKQAKKLNKVERKRKSLCFEKEKQIDAFFNSKGLDFNFETLCVMTKITFYYREEIKFIISKRILSIFNVLKKLANTYNITYHDIAHISIEDIIENWDNKNKIMSIIQSNKRTYYSEAQIQLPEVITESKDFYCFNEINSKPNFITTECIEADVICIKNNEMPDYKKIKNKVVVIDHADPGYDWIFNCEISGFITRYGGMASHMALRAYEMSMPAIIGCGNLIFQKLQAGQRVFFDCKNKKLSIDGKEIY